MLEPVYSFIVPAYNEEAQLGATLAQLFLAGRAMEEPFEVIVADDASTDRTAAVARESGARVVTEHNRQIAATRNAGARAARGSVFIFVDADTLVFPETLQGVQRALAGGAVGGGARVAFDRVTFGARLGVKLFFAVYHGLGLAAGCFVFARREAFAATGGFDERYYASEEVFLSRALRRQGRFRIVKEKVVSSGRKIRMHGFVGLFVILLKIFLRGPKALRQRRGLDLWYDGRREAHGE